PGESCGSSVIQGNHDVTAAVGHDQDRKQETQNHPDHQADPLGPGRSPQPTGAHGLHQSQVSVHADQHQEEHAAVVVHGDGHVDQLAEGHPEVPLVASGDGHSPEGKAGHHDQVGSSQIAQHAEDQTISHHTHHADQTQVGRLQGGQPQPGFGVVTARVQLWVHTGDQPIRCIHNHWKLQIKKQS
uniref:Uncharacterized protein n=1 Tax=Myripristis murdjan TaxID=586833 RepID=A0A667ZE59_9TELE